MTAEEMLKLAEMEEAIAAMIDKQRPGYFLGDDPVARSAVGGARARATALRALAAQGIETEGEDALAASGEA